MPIDLIVLAVIVGLAALVLAAVAWLFGRRRGLSFGRALRALLPPATPPAEEARRSLLLAATLRQLLLIVLVAGPLVAIALGGEEGRAALFVLGCALAFNLSLYLLLRRGRVYLASHAFPLGIFLIITWSIVINSQLMAPLVSAYLLVISSAGLLLGGRAAAAYALLCIAALPGLYALVPPEPVLPVQRLVSIWLVYASVY